MKLTIFKKIVSGIVVQPLEVLGYFCFTLPFEREGESIWFGKKVEFEGKTVYLVIGFQTTKLKPNTCWQFAVNLWRDYLNFESEGGSIVEKTNHFLCARLASCLWIEDRENPEWESDHWWSCFDEATLIGNCHEVMNLLHQHGIPWLENPKTENFC